jgi:plastocyanin
MERQEAQIDFLAGLDTRELNVRYTIEGVTQRGVVSMSDGAIKAVGIPKRDHPEVPGRMMDALDSLAASKRTDWSAQVEFQDHWLPRRARVGWLRSGYLVAFAALGYRYILRKTLARVVTQIAFPDNDVIPLSVALNPKGDPHRSSVLLIEEPPTLVGVLVQMGRNTVLLPGIDDDETFFDRMRDILQANPNAVGLAVPVLRQPGGVDAAGRAQQRGPPPGAGRHPAARHAGGVLAGGPRPARPAAAGELALELSNTAFHPAALTAPGGQVTVELTNHDLFWHSFTIEQPAVNVDIPVGGVRRVALTLPPGSYRFYCRVPGHRQAGMVGTLRVG